MVSLFTRVLRSAIVLGIGLWGVVLVSPSMAESRSKIQVMTSIFPLQEFAKVVGGERAEVQMLFSPGAEVHTSELKPSDVVKISRADIFIFIGPSMEPWADKVLRAVRERT